MARKKKIVIVDQELTPTVLATIENKKTGLIGLVLLFIIFGGVVYYLPDISVYVEQYLNPSATPSNPNTPVVTPPSNEEEDPNEITRHPYSNTLSITEKDLVLSNFSIVDTTINFRITNNGKSKVDMATADYYMELYSTDGTLLQRIKVEDASIGANTYYDATYTLTNVNVDTISFLEIKKDEYPTHIVEANEQKQATLTCRKENETVTYYLRSNAVYQIEDTFVLSNTDVEFASILPTYQALATAYSAVNGITSTITSNEINTTFKTIVDLSSNNQAIFINKLIYAAGTDAKVMRFELSARGYICD